MNIHVDGDEYGSESDDKKMKSREDDDDANVPDGSKGDSDS